MKMGERKLMLEQGNTKFKAKKRPVARFPTLIPGSNTGRGLSFWR